MRIKPIIYGLIGIIVILLSALFIFWQTSDNGEVPTLAEITRSSEGDLRDTVERVFKAETLPQGQEVALLTWLYEEHPDLATEVIQQQGNSVEGLPGYMSDAAWDFLQSNNPKPAVSIMELANLLFPNDPDVLGMRGILNVFVGQQEAARRLLEASEQRRKGNPKVDFYLGGLLVLSDEISDRARGKRLLVKTLESESEDLAELSGLILLSSPAIPLIDSEIQEIFERLEQQNVFRTDNSTLSVEALRQILTRLVPVLPGEALKIARIMLELPASNQADKLATIELAQQLEMTQEADELIDSLEIPEDQSSPEFKRFMRIQAIQLIAREEYEAGVDIILDQITSEQESTPVVQAMERALEFELPRSEEIRLLRGFLDLPVESPAASISVLRRLISIAPLREKEWIDYAKTRLLHLDPVLVGQWMMERGASDVVVESLTGEDGIIGAREVIALIEASLATGALDEAQKFLDQGRGQLSPTIGNYLQCRIFNQKGNLQEAFEYWILSHDSALVGNDYQLLKNLGFIALELEQKQSALQSLYSAFDSGIPFSVEQASSLMQLTLEMGTLSQTLPVAEFLAEKEPDNPTYQNNLAYFHFLAEENINESVETMRKLAEDYPDIYQFRLTLALGLIKAGRTNEASRLIQSTNINWEEAGTRGQMIYAVVLAATNQRIIAEGLVSNLDTESLLPEEKALLAEF